jgi:hypothetical protein
VRKPRVGAWRGLLGPCGGKINLAGNVGNMLATCRPDSQMPARLADITLLWQDKTNPKIFFLSRRLPAFTPFFVEYQRYKLRIPL